MWNRRCTSSNRRRPTVNKKINIVNSVVSNHNWYNNVSNLEWKLYLVLYAFNIGNASRVELYKQPSHFKYEKCLDVPTKYICKYACNQRPQDVSSPVHVFRAQNQSNLSMSRNLGAKPSIPGIRSFAPQSNEIIKGGFRIENNTIYKDSSVPFYNSNNKWEYL